MLAEKLVEKYSVVGKPVPKVDGRQKVTGYARYVDDITLPDMLYGKILRSRYPHARIKKIDVRKALDIPGVVAVITGSDFPSVKKMGIMKDNPPLKIDKVRSVMDEIAAVAAVDEDIALEALDAIEVEYEELPAVFDPEEAMREDAPLVHEELGTNIVNLNFKFSTDSKEELDRIFDEAPYVVEDEYRVHRVSASPMGTMGVVAHYNAAGELTIYTNTQAPFLYRRDMAEITGIDPSRIRVIQPEIGGAFGRGMDLYPVDVIAVLLSMKTRKPVKIVFSRREELEYAPPRQPAVIRMRTAAGRDGRLIAREANLILDAGAYVSWGPFDARVMMATTTGLYQVPHVSFNATVVYTNNPYCGTQRGAGNPQITFAIEQQMDALAEELGMDPVEFRILNANRPNTTTPQGMVISSCGMVEAIREAAKAIGWKGRGMAGPNKGIGFACYFHVGGGARVYRSDGCGAIVTIDDFGKVTLITGSTDLGTGSDTALIQIVAEELGVPVSRVSVVNDDASIRPWDVGTHASRATFVAGNAALLAAREAKKQLLEIASSVFNTPPEELDIKNGFVYVKSDESKRMEYDKVVRRGHFKEHGRIIIAHAFYDPPNEMQDENWMGNISATYTFGCQAVLVEVDRETGEIKVLKVVSAHDVGRVINPIAAEGQVHGGVVMGVGYTLYEELALDRGRVINATFMDYMLPSTREAPEIVPIFVQTEDQYGPYGAKGLGETGCIPTPAAIANAVYDAIGKRPKKLPIKPWDILD